MSISYDKFLSWAENRFGDVVAKGNEVKINSIWVEDHKHHLWCNPSGGKKAREFGVYRCWKTDKRGSLISLVMEVDKCTFDEALDTLEAADISFHDLEDRLEEMFDKKASEVIIEPAPESKIQLPEFSHLITDLPEDDYFRIAAEVHLSSRKIPTDGLFVCVAGDYKNRIIIPYYDRTGKLIYFNGRYLGTSKEVLRYMGPKEEQYKVGKGDVIFMPHWPEPGTRVYFTEGEFDAKAIYISDLPSGAFGGKAVTDKQCNLIRSYPPTICLDNDPSGRKATPGMAEKLHETGITDVNYVRPPVSCKDWNEMLVKLGPNILRAYILSHEKSFSFELFTGDSLRAASI